MDLHNVLIRYVQLMGNMEMKQKNDEMDRLDPTILSVLDSNPLVIKGPHQ